MEDAINDILEATQKPFGNRLQVVCYMWLRTDHGQEVAHRKAIDLAAFLGEWIYLDVDRVP